jgi:hypothetical protein
VLGISSLQDGVIITVIGGAILAVIGFMIRAGLQTYDKRKADQNKAHVLDELERADAASLAEYFFGKEGNPRTGIPAREGWTHKVERRLDGMHDAIQNLESTVVDIGDRILKGQKNGHS